MCIQLLMIAYNVLIVYIGSRVTDEILRLVPNVEVFRDSLRCIKLWAHSTRFLYVQRAHADDDIF